jgi:hypothetical protein
MNATSKVTIVILSVLCVGLAASTIVQATSRARPAEQPPATDSIADADAIAADTAAPLDVAAFEDIEAPADAAPLGFVGEWLNEDGETGSLTRITVTNEEDRFAVQPWAAKPGAERPYGPSMELDCTTNPTEITWDAGFAEQRMRLAVMPDGLLRVDRVAACMNHTCGTPQPTTTDRFYKATPQDLTAHQLAVGEAVAQPDDECLTILPGGG